MYKSCSKAFALQSEISVVVSTNMALTQTAHTICLIAKPYQQLVENPSLNTGSAPHCLAPTDRSLLALGARKMCILITTCYIYLTPNIHDLLIHISKAST